MSSVIATDVQHLEQDAIVQLFELDCRAYDAGILRFTPDPVDGGAALWNGYQYDYIPIEAEGFAWQGKGTLPRPKLAITAMEMALLSLVINSNDLIGTPVVRRRTYRKHLDDGVDPDPEALFPVDHYVIERKSKQNRTEIEFELSAAMDQQGRKIPARQVLRDTCTHTYRFWDGQQYRYEGVTCPYTGSAEFEESGASASTGGDKCGKRLSDCKKRFGQHGALPFYGFPGVARIRMR